MTVTPTPWPADGSVCFLIKWRWFHYLNRPFGTGRRASVLQPQKPPVQQDNQPLFVSLEICFCCHRWTFNHHKPAAVPLKTCPLCLNQSSQIFFYISSFDKCALKIENIQSKKVGTVEFFYALWNLYLFSLDMSLSKAIRSDFSALNTVWLHVLFPFLQAVIPWKSFNKLLAIKGNVIIFAYFFPHK